MNDNYKNDKAVLFFPEEDLLFEIHLLPNVIWGTWIFLLLEERFDSFSLLFVNIN